MAQLPGELLSRKTIDFERRTIDMDIPGIHDVKIFDLDGDNDYDIIGGSEQTPYSASVGIVWWRNDGGHPAVWTKFMIDDSFLHVMSVDVGFINDDELPDILASSWSNGKITWWRNSGNPETGWTSYDIVSGWVNPHDGVCQDIDGDGKTDIIGVSAGNNKISIFYNQGGTVPIWQENEVTSDFGGAKSVIIEDLDNDSLPDLIGAGDGCDDIAWWKNLGGVPVSWEKQFITTYFNGSNGLDAEDMDNDNQLDIIGSGWEGNEVSFWTCNDITANNWQKTMVTDQLPIAVNAIGRDIDLDGDKDIIAVGKVPGELVIYLNEETCFTKEVLYPGFNGGSALAVFDIDQDGDDDIIAGAGILKTLYLYENKTIVTATPGNTPGSSGLRIFPNPSEGVFLVIIPEGSASEIQIGIFDTNGKQVVRNNMMLPVNNQVRIIAPGLENGFYMLKILVNDHLFQGKLIISRPYSQSH